VSLQRGRIPIRFNDQGDLIKGGLMAGSLIAAPAVGGALATRTAAAFARDAKLLAKLPGAYKDARLARVNAQFAHRSFKPLSGVAPRITAGAVAKAAPRAALRGAVGTVGTTVRYGPVATVAAEVPPGGNLSAGVQGHGRLAALTVPGKTYGGTFGVVQNLAHDALNLPANVVPSIYMPAAAIVHWKVTGDSEPLKQLWTEFQHTDALGAVSRGDFQGFLKAVHDHPLYFALEMGGAWAGVGRGAGAAVRAVAPEGSRAAYFARTGIGTRKPIPVGENGGMYPRGLSPNLMTSVIQRLRDQYTHPGLQGRVRVAHPTIQGRRLRMTKSQLRKPRSQRLRGHLIDKVIADAEISAQRRQDAVEKAAQDTRIEGPVGPALRDVIEGIVAPHTFVADIDREVARLTAERANMGPRDLVRNGQRIEALQTLKADPALMEKLVAARDAFAKIQPQLEAEAAQLSRLDASQMYRAAFKPVGIARTAHLEGKVGHIFVNDNPEAGPLTLVERRAGPDPNAPKPEAPPEEAPPVEEPAAPVHDPETEAAINDVLPEQAPGYHQAQMADVWAKINAERERRGEAPQEPNTPEAPAPEERPFADPLARDPESEGRNAAPEPQDPAHPKIGEAWNIDAGVSGRFIVMNDHSIHLYRDGQGELHQGQGAFLAHFDYLSDMGLDFADAVGFGQVHPNGQTFGWGFAEIETYPIPETVRLLAEKFPELSPPPRSIHRSDNMAAKVWEETVGVEREQEAPDFNDPYEDEYTPDNFDGAGDWEEAPALIGVLEDDGRVTVQADVGDGHLHAPLATALDRGGTRFRIDDGVVDPDGDLTPHQVRRVLEQDPTNGTWAEPYTPDPEPPPVVVSPQREARRNFKPGDIPPDNHTPEAESARRQADAEAAFGVNPAEDAVPDLAYTETHLATLTNKDIYDRLQEYGVDPMYAGQQDLVGEGVTAQSDVTPGAVVQHARSGSATLRGTAPSQRRDIWGPLRKRIRSNEMHRAYADLLKTLSSKEGWVTRAEAQQQIHPESGDKLINLAPYKTRAEVTKGLMEGNPDVWGDEALVAYLEADAGDVLREATLGTADGDWHIIPGKDIKRIQEHAEKPWTSAGALTTAWKRGVLVTTPTWYAGNIYHTSMVAILNGLAPVGFARLAEAFGFGLGTGGHRAAAHLTKREEGGIITGAVSETSVRPLHRLPVRPGEKINEPDAFIRIMEKLSHNQTSGDPRLIFKMWDTTARALLSFNGNMIEEPLFAQMLGKINRKHYNAMRPMWERTFKLQGEAIKDFMDGQHSSTAQLALADEINKQTGNWHIMNPTEKKVRTLVPFYMWHRAALRFVFVTVPHDHPVFAGLAAAAMSMTQDEREKLGLDLFAGKSKDRQPGYLQGAIPVKNNTKLRQTANLTAFGMLADYPGNVASSILPFANFAVLGGTDWKGDKYVTADNEELSQFQRVGLMAYLTFEPFLPFATVANKIVAKGRATEAPFFWYKGKRTMTTRQAIRRALTPPPIPGSREYGVTQVGKRTGSRRTGGPVIDDNLANQPTTPNLYQGTGSWYSSP
jgi:hypothetical protein